MIYFENAAEIVLAFNSYQYDYSKNHTTIFINSVDIFGNYELHEFENKKYLLNCLVKGDNYYGYTDGEIFGDECWYPHPCDDYTYFSNDSIFDEAKNYIDHISGFREIYYQMKEKSIGYSSLHDDYKNNFNMCYRFKGNPENISNLKILKIRRVNPGYNIKGTKDFTVAFECENLTVFGFMHNNLCNNYGFMDGFFDDLDTENRLNYNWQDNETFLFDIYGSKDCHETKEEIYEK